jgi:hypothetical protein
MRTFSVVTTIHQPSAALRSLARQAEWPCIVVGDRKTPQGVEWPAGVCFLPYEGEEATRANAARRASELARGTLSTSELIDAELAAVLPIDHYSRKNLGYIAALRLGAEVIYETDDDNEPLGALSVPAAACTVHCFSPESRSAGGVKQSERRDVRGPDASVPEFVNVYKAFTAGNVWPRGLPLERVLDRSPVVERRQPLRVGVWQGLVDGEPDVDAIYRLVSNEPVRFDHAVKMTNCDAASADAAASSPVRGVVLPSGCYCPFNSQNTYWFADAFAVMYLPTAVSSRVSDILRGYVAQRLLWECGLHVAFSTPTAVQRRNPHDLMRDFRDELDLYLNAGAVCRVLDRADFAIRSASELPAALVAAYGCLVAAGLVPAAEMPIVRAWAGAVERAKFVRRAAA